jgi:hypothetical protein
VAHRRSIVDDLASSSAKFLVGFEAFPAGAVAIASALRA